MRSKIEAMSLTLVLAVVLAAAAASAAQAGELHVTNTPGKADITGQQTTPYVFQFTAPAAVVKCNQARFEGTISDGGSGPQTTASEVTLTPRFTDCQITAPVINTAQVKMNGCKYTLTGSLSALKANMDITGCTSGKKIEIIGGGCTITIGEQGPLSHIAFTNEGSGETQEATADSTVSGMQYQTEGLFCILGSAQHSDAHVTGKAKYKAFIDQGTTTQATHNGHQYNELICGAQRGLFAT